MTNTIQALNKSVDNWLKDLKTYRFDQLLIKPSTETWSLGQVYMHLIESTHYFILQAKLCATNDDHRNEETSTKARSMILNNEFPNLRLDGPPTNAFTKQPESKGKIAQDLLALKEEIELAGTFISKSNFQGKTKHPGLSYFNAYEWLLFSEMHFRHHLRQKKRIDDFLNNK